MKTKPSTVSQPSGVSTTAVIVGCAVSFLLFAIGAFLPGYRVWGFNSWAYLPIFVTLLVVAVGAAVGLAAYRLLSRRTVSSSAPTATPDETSRYVLASAVTIIMWLIAFILMAGRTHFLGDGYALLDNLAKADPSLKPTEIGTGIIVHGVQGLLGGAGEAAALTAYQLVSIAAGALFLICAALFAGSLMNDLHDRLLLLFGLSSGGYMLLFFGYVENYPLFGLGIGLFMMTGVLIIHRKTNRWLILVPLVIASFLHVLGLILIPAALYVLLRDTRLSRRWTRLPQSGKVGAVIGAMLLALVGFGYYYSRDLFFRFAFVPLIADRFVVDGYTMFSFKHLADFISLLILVLPGLPIVLIFLLHGNSRRLFQAADLRFVTVAAISTLGAAFVLDPKLGLARDWDLFSFPGIPLVLLSCLLITRARAKAPIKHLAIVAVIALGLISVFSRASVQRLPDQGLRLMRDYLKMDVLPGRNGYYVLSKYLIQIGDTAAHAEAEQAREIIYPQENLLRRARDLGYTAHAREAKGLVESAIAKDPTYAEGWIGLSFCYAALGKFDSSLACARIADGLNPYNGITLYAGGSALYQLRRFKEARQWLERSYAIDTAQANPLWTLANVYRDEGNQAKYLEILCRAAGKEKARADLLKTAANECINRQQFAQASEFLSRLLAKGTDTAYVRDLAAKYPALKVAF